MFLSNNLYTHANKYIVFLSSCAHTFEINPRPATFYFFSFSVISCVLLVIFILEINVDLRSLGTLVFPNIKPYFKKNNRRFITYVQTDNRGFILTERMGSKIMKIKCADETSMESQGRRWETCGEGASLP